MIDERARQQINRLEQELRRIKEAIRDTTPVNDTRGLNDTIASSFVVASSVKAHASSHQAGGSDEFSVANYLDWAEASAPSSPGAGVERVYAADEGGHSFIHTVDNLGVDLEINRDSVHVVRNETGVAMTKGDVVHINGGNGNFPTVVLADANGTSTTPAHGVLLENISDNAQGLMLSSGDLTGLDLQSFSQGDIVYLSETAGAFTSTKPTFPSFQQEIGVVVKNTAAGILAVFITDSNKLLDEDDMSSDSADFGATQQSIKAFVETFLGFFTQPLYPNFRNSSGWSFASTDQYINSQLNASSQTAYLYLSAFSLYNAVQIRCRIDCDDAGTTARLQIVIQESVNGSAFGNVGTSVNFDQVGNGSSGATSQTISDVTFNVNAHYRIRLLKSIVSGPGNGQAFVYAFGVTF